MTIQTEKRPISLGKRSYFIDISGSLEDSDWDEFVEKTPGGSYVQTSCWAELKSESNWSSCRVKLLSESKEIVAGAQILIKHVGPLIKIAYLNKAPLLCEPDEELANLVIEQIQTIFQSLGIWATIIQLPYSSESLTRAFRSFGVSDSNFRLPKAATIQVDLSLDTDDLLKKMRKKTRNSVRRGPKHGLTFREGGHDDLPTFYKLHRNTAARQGFTPHSFEMFERNWLLFHPKGYLHFFLVELEGEPVSGNWVYSVGERVVATCCGWTGEHASKRPNEMMDWHSMIWTKANGYRYYDLGDMDLDTANMMSNGEKLTQENCDPPSYYKVGLGGSSVIFPLPLVYIRNRLIRSVFERLNRSKIVNRICNDFLIRVSSRLFGVTA